MIFWSGRESPRFLDLEEKVIHVKLGTLPARGAGASGATDSAAKSAVAAVDCRRRRSGVRDHRGVVHCRLGCFPGRALLLHLLGCSSPTGSLHPRRLGSRRCSRRSRAIWSTAADADPCCSENAPNCPTCLSVRGGRPVQRRPRQEDAARRRTMRFSSRIAHQVGRPATTSGPTTIDHRPRRW